MINISGNLTIQDNTGQQYTINAGDLICEKNLVLNEYCVSYDTGNWSIDIIVEKKNGTMIGQGNWNTKNCTILKNQISFS